MVNKQQNEQKDDRNNRLVFLLVFFICALLSMILSILVLAETKISFLIKYFTVFSVGICIFLIVLYLIAVFCALRRRDGWMKTLLSFFILWIFAMSILFILQKTGFFAVVKTPEKLQAYLEKAGVWMPICFVLLQFLQVVVLPIPSIVTTVAGVALFGAFWTMIYSLIGILAGSFLAFFIGRKLGERAVTWIVGEETLRKWQKKMKGKDSLILTLTFLLPLFPDDVLCFLAGLSTMSNRYFITVITLSRIVAIASTCYSIDFIPFNTWWGILIWCLFAIVIVFSVILSYKNMDKIQNYIKRRRKK